jgi:hypothetical protein
VGAAVLTDDDFDGDISVTLPPSEVARAIARSRHCSTFFVAARTVTRRAAVQRPGSRLDYL